MRILKNLGFFLIGAGAGILGTSFLLRKELRKPVCDEIIYISAYPDDDDDEDGEDSDISDNSNNRSKGNRSDKLVSASNRNQERYSEDGPGYGYGSLEPSRGGSRDKRQQEFGTDQTNIVNVYGQRKKDTGVAVGKDGVEGQDSWDSYERSRRKRENDYPYSKLYRSTSSPTELAEQYEREIDTSIDVDVDISDEVDDLPDYEQNLHDEYNLERVEDNFEIFIGDTPQDAVMVTFYAGDHTLCDETEQIIPYPEDVVGMVALKRLVEGGPGALGDEIFVRNLRTCINYEVVLDLGCYSQTVLGQFESHLHSDGGKGVGVV